MRVIHCEGYYGSYTWKKTVYMSDDDDRDPVQVAISQLRREGHMSLGMASCGGHIVDEEYIED